MNKEPSKSAGMTMTTSGEKSPNTDMNIAANVSIANDNEIYCCWKTSRLKRTKSIKNKPKQQTNPQ